MVEGGGRYVRNVKFPYFVMVDSYCKNVQFHVNTTDVKNRTPECYLRSGAGLEKGGGFSHLTWASLEAQGVFSYL